MVLRLVDEPQPGTCVLNVTNKYVPISEKLFA